MAKVTVPTNLSNLEKQKDVQRFGAAAINQIVQQVNGNIDVTNVKADANLLGSQLSPEAGILGSQLAIGTIGITQIAANSVGATQLIDSSVTTAKIANNAVTQGKLADGSVGTNQLINSNVTYDKTSSTNQGRSSVVTFSTGSTTLQSVTGMTASIPISGAHPVQVFLESGASAISGAGYIGGVGATTGFRIYWQLKNGADVINCGQLSNSSASGRWGPTAVNAFHATPGSAGTNNYILLLAVNSEGTETAEINNCRLVAVEYK